MKLLEAAVWASVWFATTYAFSIRKGADSDEILSANFPFLDLQDVLVRLKQTSRDILDTKKATIINIGAADRNQDPIYSLQNENIFPNGYRIIGYECHQPSAKLLKKNHPAVLVRPICVTRKNIIHDMKSHKVPKSFPVLKIDIDSTDATIMDTILSEYSPLVIYAEIAWDFPPPIDFAMAPGGVLDESSSSASFSVHSRLGCFSMSLNMAHRILQAHNYVLIEASFVNILAVPRDVAHLFDDRPHDPYFWYQTVKSPRKHHHYMKYGSPFEESVPGMYTELLAVEGKDNFGKPVEQMRTIDETMRKVAKKVSLACDEMGQPYLLAVGDRCCAPQWGVSKKCVCEI